MCEKETYAYVKDCTEHRIVSVALFDHINISKRDLYVYVKETCTYIKKTYLHVKETNVYVRERDTHM